jgi:predicted amidohydrolase
MADEEGSKPGKPEGGGVEVGVVQFAPQFGQKERNVERALELASGMDADIVVLPELFDTGYQFLHREEALELAEPVPDGPTTWRLESYAREHGCYIVAGVAEREGGRLYNSACLVGPRGTLGIYRKAHLFEREKEWSEPGNTGFPVWDLGEVRTGVLICWDWRFPEATRTLALKGTELLVHPANLILPWCQESMRTRSVENRIFTATANRIGAEQRGDWVEHRFTGGSQVTDPDGNVLFRLGEDEEGSRSVLIDHTLARNKEHGRSHLFQDRRTDLYEL